MKVSTRIIFSFVILGVFIIIANILGIRPIKTQLKEVSRDPSAALYSIQSINSNLTEAVEESFAYVISGDIHEKEEFLEWADHFKENVENFSYLADQVLEQLDRAEEEEEKVLYNKIISGQSELVEHAKTMFKEYEKTGSVTHKTFQGYEEAIGLVTMALKKSVAIEKKEVDQFRQIAMDTIDRSENTVYGIAFVSLILAVGMGLFISKTISGPLLKLQKALVLVGRGDFTAEVEVSSRDEIGTLARFFNKMAKDLQATTVSRNSLEEINQSLLVKIKEKDEAEERVQLERQNLYNMLDSLPMAFHLQAPDYTVPFANKVFRERFGEPKKRMCHDLMHNRSQPCEVCTTFKVFNHGKDEVSVWEANDGRNYITVCSPFKDVDGSPLVMEMALDITEQENAKKEAIRAKDEAEKANLAKSEFLTCMSHELRTPMNAILGFSQILIMDQKNTLNPFQISNVQHILKAGKHLLELISDVLDLSKIESDHIAVSIEDVPINSLIFDTLKLLQPLLKEKELSLKVVPLEIPEVTARADPIRFKQVLLNIISNAIKYNRQGGSITVSCDNLGDQNIQICIQDTGIGISSENLKKIFKPFQRVKSKTEVIEGTGVGLTISHKLMNLMQGSLKVQSEVGKGSLFSIILPEGKRYSSLDELASIVWPDEFGSKNERSDFKVLYIEDNPASIELVSSILFRQNVKILHAPDAKLGIELAIVHQPDLILMDINLPGMNGYKALKVIRADSVLNATPVIALSADGLEIDIEKGLSADFTDYISKPIQVLPFLKKVNQYIS
jgi:signal transduction histidine kinase/CheY-like chemotaxis protein/HAMP domain-containing protein